jgi:hypothetical protein
MIKINLEDTIEPKTASADFMDYSFISSQRGKPDVELLVKIRNINDPLLPNVFNLGFGPSDGLGGINDKISLVHTNTSKVFSTILLFAITFLQENPGTTIGIDGSDETRAYLYHRMFQTNYESLKEIVIIIGVDWYVRLLRNGTIECDANGFAFFKPRPEPFDLQRKRTDLYRYYMITLTE